MKILQVNSSIRGEASASTRLSNAIVERLKALAPGSSVEVRDLSSQRFLDGAALGALFTPAEQRTPEQAARVAEDDAAIAQLLAADAIVLGVPLYNLDVPVQLKAWIDAITRAGATFRYTEKGPAGLVQGKKVYVAFARGGIYKDSPMDTQKAYLKNILGLLGITDVTWVHAEGLAMGDEPAQAALAQAGREIEALAL
jgi:FMN-dependent NADH-azoreductase